jgi:hypothetical protein
LWLRRFRFPLLYAVIGGFLLYPAENPRLNNQEPPPVFLGWIFIVLGAVLFLAAITMAICILISGRYLARCEGYSFALVIACIERLCVPFGTILFTIVVLSRESVKALTFAPQATASP